MLIGILCLYWTTLRGQVVYVEWTGSTRKLYVTYGAGLVYADFTSDALLRGPPQGLIISSHPQPPGPTPITKNFGPGKLGFAFYETRTVGRPKGNWKIGGQRLLILWVPFWFFPMMTAAMPVWWIVKAVLRFRARPPAGAILCANCGYDLRATRDRCPECGQVPNSPLPLGKGTS